jgi:hypothetical protein
VSHAHGDKLSSHDQLHLGALGHKIVGVGVIVGGVSLLIAVILGAIQGDGFDRFFRSYLVAFFMVLAIALGGLFFTMLQYAVRAGWSATVRRLSEGIASNLMWMWVLFIPVLIAVFTTDLYHWMHPVGETADEVLIHKSPYFFGGTAAVQDEVTGEWTQTRHIPWFWLIRAVVFFGIWAALARFFVFASIAQDKSGDVNLTHQMQWWAPLGILLYALTQTFASLDWIMSLEAHWFSTIYPVYFFAASCCGCFSLMIVAMFFIQKQGKVPYEITTEHYHEMGKALFAFGVVFWAYIGYSQYMLQWYANIPETTGWWITRSTGGWGAVSLLLLVGHFVGPFLILLSRHVKRFKAVLVGVACWMLFMHFIDIYWLVMPRIPHELLYTAPSMMELRAQLTPEQLGYGWHALDILLVISLAAFLVAGTAYRLSKAALVPQQDPRLPEALAFHNA